MRGWPSPDVPRLEATGPEVRVFDVASGRSVTTRPDGPARLYVCGITPYDATHLGHAATFLAFDLLHRAWRSAGHEVTYVQNVTDVDDPLLDRARQTGEDWRVLADRETDLLREDMTALRVLAPHHFVGAVESIPMIVAMIERLREAGAVYEVEGDLYFSVSADPEFGQVSHWQRDEMIRVFPDRGGDPDRDGKKDPLDCLLWRLQRPGEPSWESPYGDGRPGWHVECAAIALEHLGHDFDVQGGGNDLVFPHHEMSASEAQVAHPGHRFAQAYVYQGMVGLDGEKMSKSQGNLVLVSELRRSGADPMAVRLALLRHHYRDDWSWTDRDLEDAANLLTRLRAAAAAPGAAPAGPVVEDVLAALADDLDSPRAADRLEQWVAETEAAQTDGRDAPSAGSRASDGSPGSDPGATIRSLVDAALGLAL